MKLLRAETLVVACLVLLSACVLFLWRRVEALESRVPVTVTVHGVPAADVPAAVKGLLPDIMEAAEAR